MPLKSWQLHIPSYPKVTRYMLLARAENWLQCSIALARKDENILAQLQKRELNFNFRYRKQPPIQIVYGAKGRQNRGALWIPGIP